MPTCHARPDVARRLRLAAGLTQADAAGFANADLDFEYGPQGDPIDRNHPSRLENYGHAGVPVVYAQALFGVYGVFSEEEFEECLLPEELLPQRLKGTAMFKPVRAFFKAVGAFPPEPSLFIEWLDSNVGAPVRTHLPTTRLGERFLRLMTIAGYAGGGAFESRRQPAVEVFHALKAKRFGAEAGVYPSLGQRPLEERLAIAAQGAQLLPALETAKAAERLDDFLVIDADVHYLIAAAIRPDNADAFNTCFDEFCETDAYQEFLERVASSESRRKAAKVFMDSAFGFFLAFFTELSEPHCRLRVLRRLLQNHVKDFEEFLTDEGSEPTPKAERPAEK